jgi:hypothetical protein
MAPRLPGSSPGERSNVKLFDGPAAVRLEVARPRSGKVGMRDDRARVRTERLPLAAAPSEPRVFALVEDVQRLVAQLCELGPPACSAPHGVIRQDRSDHINLLAGVHLVPQGLQDLPDSDALGLTSPASSSS